MATLAIARPTSFTRTALTVAGPLWALVALTQAATREGFDLTRHPLSALSNGDLGWLQITNFLLAGALTVIGASALPTTWSRRLTRVYGLGMMAAGVLVMDPADGFPLGTPYGMPDSMSWHSYGHMVAGSISFIALIATGYVLGRHFSRTGNRPYAIASRAAATAALLGNLWAMTGGKAGSLTLAVGVITAMLWLAFVAPNRNH